MTTTRSAAAPSSTVRSTYGSTSAIGDAIQVTFLLSDWKNFGIAERVCYHLDLIETLASASSSTKAAKPPDEENRLSINEGTVPGVVSLLECVPSMPWKDVSRFHRKILRNKIRDFNLQADRAHETNPKTKAHQPQQLPLRLSPTTRVAFAYEMTRMAFILDASPTLVTAYGASGADECLCATDRIGSMVQTFFESLSKTVLAPYMTKTNEWTPVLAVTVLAVYPVAGSDHASSDVLVRDYRIESLEDASVLAEKIQDWVMSEVEDKIAKQLNQYTGSLQGLMGYDAWTTQKYTSNLSDLLDAADVALDFLPSRARPCIVLATDCRSVACQEILDLFAFEERLDVPIHILDLSSPASHPNSASKSVADFDETNFLVSDSGGHMAYPLFISDDSETLLSISRATAGCFIDSQLLDLTSQISVGQVPPGSPLSSDPFLTFRRRALRPNTLQWYILFSMSPLTPYNVAASTKTTALLPTSPAGRLVPPNHLRERIELRLASTQRVDSTIKDESGRHGSVASFTSILSGKAASVREKSAELRRPPHRATFSTYVVTSVRIKSLLLARVKEGYRAKLYGTSTHDLDKVSIQLTLPLENGTVLHYELQYKALDSKNPFVGVAHVKVEVSGNRNFVENVKNDFLAYSTGRNVASRLCKNLWWIRREDELQTFLCPMEWGDKLDSRDSPFVRRLGNLSHLQLVRHYRVDRFDVVCTGRMPYLHGEDLPFSDFLDDDDGERDFFDTLDKWSTQCIEDKVRYVKRIQTPDGLTACCVVRVIRSPVASRLFTVESYTTDGTDIMCRLHVISQLKETLRSLQDVTVLAKRMFSSLVGVKLKPQETNALEWRCSFLESHFDSDEWSLVYDPELLEILMRRRHDIGYFLLLNYTKDTYAFFAKDISVMTGKCSDDPMEDVYLVEYQVHLKGVDKVPVISMHVEKDVGIFLTDAKSGATDHLTRALRIFDRVKGRDQECSKALRSRTNLLRLFSGEGLSLISPEDLSDHVGRLLVYASPHTRELRFFRDNHVANMELEKLTVELMLSGRLVSDIVKLDLKSTQKSGMPSSGHWFLIRFDRYTLSFMNLAIQEKQKEDGNAYSFRELTFHTFGISDLYCVRGETVDDDDEVTEGHLSEYVVVEEFADDIQRAHREIYAQAAYQAMRLQGAEPNCVIHSADFEHVLEVCEFVEVSNIFISQESLLQSDEKEHSRLMKSVKGLFSPIPGDEDLLFFSAEEPGLYSQLLLQPRPASPDSGSSEGSFDDELSADESENREDTVRTESRKSAFNTVPPVFIRFSFDDKYIPYNELLSIKKGANLKVFMSLFKDHVRHKFQQLPQLHSSAAIELENALKSYIAEQTLERLRSIGGSIDDIDFEAVRKCMGKARDVIVSFFDINFYSSKLDNFVPASAPAGNESAVEEGFSLLLRELLSQPDFHLRQVSAECFCVIESEENGTALKYWSFISVKKSLGLISTEVHHPGGVTTASSVLSSLQSFVAKTCHRTNQLLMLQSLHRTHLASPYLISDLGENEERIDSEKFAMYSEGCFSCPVVFTVDFSLFHRCSAQQVIASLVSTTLHSFAVSNRRRIFVYKDESMRIFYLTLGESQKDDSGKDGKEQVQLCVFGIEEPGPSITVQLTRLLRKKILSLAVEVWSSLLKKNPHLSWKAADLEFLRTFRSEWSAVEDSTDEVAVGGTDYWFALPASVNDPLICLMYFRQNLCGSTFFHRLNTGVDDDMISEESHYSEDDLRGGAEISFDPREFTFFYNNAASLLDPKLQALSTLTRRGKEYSERTGSGIAIVELSLMTGDGKSPDILRIGIPPLSSESHQLSNAAESFRAKEVSDPITFSREGEPGSLVHVRLTDTALNREALKEWLLLTMNQVVVAWYVERQIQKSRTGLLSSFYARSSSLDPTVALDNRLGLIDIICPGLPWLIEILRMSSTMPHPAVQAADFDSVMKSSSVASHTIGLLRDAIAKGLSRYKGDSCWKRISREAVLIRSSRSDTAHVVKLSSKIGNNDSASALGEASLGDSPIDCPEYICYFCWEQYSEMQEDEIGDPLPMVFPEVKVGDEITEKHTSAFSQRLVNVKNKLPSAFRRSFAFVLSVKRNRRSFLMYNWDPKLAKTVIAAMKELEATSISKIGTGLRSSQARCLGNMAPLVQHSRLGHRRILSHRRKANIKAEGSQALSVSVVNSVSDERLSTGPPKRIQRPLSIRRPKLVGKSVEGAAVQAMAASRARARVQTVGQTKTSSVLAPGVSASPPFEKLNEDEEADVDGEEREHFKQKFLQVVGHSWAKSFGMTARSFELLQEYWFRIGEEPVRQPVRDLILFQTKPVWNDCCELLSLTRLLSSDLPIQFAHHLEKEMQPVGLCKVLPTRPNVAGDSWKVVYFMAAIRVASMTSFLVFRVAPRRFSRPKKMEVIDCDVWMMKLFRSDSKRPAPKRRSTRSLEKRCTAMNAKLGFVAAMVSSIDAQLFDYSASLIRDAINRLDDTNIDSDYLLLLEKLIQRFSLDIQQEYPRLVFRAFEATIILNSYEDKFIDKFDASALFDHLYKTKEKDIIQCGFDSILFKERIELHGSKTVCFLKRDITVKTKMWLVYLCHTGGANIDQYVFPEDSNVAATMFKLIVMEGARIAYDLLRSSAIEMYRDSLWDLARKRNSNHTPQMLDQLLSMVTSKSVFENTAIKSLAIDSHLCIDPRDLFVRMARESLFCPNQKIHIEGNDHYQMLFYNLTLDAFMLFMVKEGRISDLMLMSREVVSDEASHRFAEMFEAYLFHYLWKS